MLVLGYARSTPARVPCIVLQAQLPVFRAGIKALLVMGNAVYGNAAALLADPANTRAYTTP